MIRSIGVWLILAAWVLAAPLPLRFKEPIPLDQTSVKTGEKVWVAYQRGWVRKATVIETHQLLPIYPSTKGLAFDNDDCDYRWVRMEDFPAFRTKEEAARHAVTMKRRWYERSGDDDKPVRRGE